MFCNDECQRGRSESVAEFRLSPQFILANGDSGLLMFKSVVHE